MKDEQHRSLPYGCMSGVYDLLMADAPYGAWTSWIEETVDRYCPRARLITDLGCGTGTVTVNLAVRRKNIQFTGVDLSVDMLAVAAAKSEQAGVRVQWIEQDVANIQLLERQDVFFAVCDVLNYITEEDVIRQTLRNVADQLRPGGLFLFDCHSIYHVKQHFSGHTYGSLDEETAYIWQSACDPQTYSVEHVLSFFVREENGLYRRFDEYHRQRAYPRDQVEQWLQEAGLTVREVSADFRSERPREDSERLFFVAQK
jgi:SAM-dependent methyltransferase